MKASFFALGTTNLKGWLPRVLLSLFGFRWAATEKSVSLWESLYIKDSLAVFLLVGRVSQLSSCSICHVLHIGCSCQRRIVLPFSEVSPAFRCLSRSRDLMRHFHIRGLVGLRSFTPFPLPIWDSCNIYKFSQA